MYKWLSLLLLTSVASASPIQHLEQVGKGEMQYLFWTIYEAQFYVEPIQNVEGKQSNTANSSKALKIEYFKSIDNSALIDATTDQWRYLGYSQTDIDAWVASIEDIWPDVVPGNTLTLLVGDSQQSQFYFNDELIGTIDDTNFSEAFLSIWLSENTSEPKLRQQLLGFNK